MRILWTVNLIPANLAAALNKKAVVLGGWVESMAGRLRLMDGVELAIACKTDPDTVFDTTVQNVRYFSLGYSSKTTAKSLKNRCAEILDQFSPDLIHIEGTEFLHARAMLDAGKEKNIPTVVSMQGILNGYYPYQCGNLQLDEMMFSKSAANIFAAWCLHFRKVKWFRKRMAPEREIIEQAQYILGRTFWDRAHSYRFNPGAKYYICNRTLREPFYRTSWDIDKMERHSIYVGNSYSALKGIHFVISALPQLIREYPDIKVYAAGYEPFKANDTRAFYKKGYGAYIKKLIHDLHVEDHIVFTGPLKAEEVADRLSHVNAYVLCSVIENSPNTLGEAMLIGTPCVASYVGGAPDMAIDGIEALFYRCDDPALLAWNIKRIFDDDAFAQSLSRNAHAHASVTHDGEKNAQQLYSVYQEVLKDAGK